MSAVIDRAKAHFVSISEPREIIVPEWGENGKPLSVFVTPLTLAEKRKLFKKAQDGDIGFLVDAVIMKAKDENGEPLFTVNNRVDLTHKCDPGVIERVASAIPGTDLENAEEDAIKN